MAHNYSQENEIFGQYFYGKDKISGFDIRQTQYNQSSAFGLQNVTST